MSEPNPPNVLPPARRDVLTRGLWLLWGLTAGVLLYGSLALFSALKFQINDHGIYTNFMWNSAHGAPFRYLLDGSYLGVHLSYTLLLLAPLFRVWDHPFLLCAVQWGMGVGGSLITAWIAKRAGLRNPIPAAFALLQLAYPFTQAVLLCDFHGVCLYYVLFPALYAALVFRRNLAWVPLLLIAGLREEAALLVVSMLMWFAWRERWKMGWVFAGLAVAYAVFAMAVLFPWINGQALHASRSDYVGAKAVAAGFSVDGWITRGVALFWLALPVVVLMRRRAFAPVLVLPSVALLIPMCSGVPRINSLEVMYSAAPFTLLVLAMLEGLRRADIALSNPRSFAWKTLGVTAVAVALIDRVGPDEHGARMPRTWALDSIGRSTLRAAREIPRDGILFTTRSLAGITANRRDLMILRDGVTPEHAERVQYVFIENEALQRGLMVFWTDKLQRGEFGVVYSDHYVSLLSRGAPTNRNAELLTAVFHPGQTLPLFQTEAKFDENVRMPERGDVRYWPASETGTPSVVKCPKALLCKAGRYRAYLLYKPGPMPAGGESASLSIVAGNTGNEVARVALTNASAEFAWMEFPIEWSHNTHLGVIIRGGRQPLWLDRFLVAPATP